MPLSEKHVVDAFGAQRANEQSKPIGVTFALSPNRGSMTAVDVMTKPEGSERDDAIHEWCASVWEAFAQNRQTVVDLLRQHGIV